MFNINGWELAVIALIALLVLGPDRLPAFLAQAGRLLAQLRQHADQATSEITREFKAITEMAEAQWDEVNHPGQPPGGDSSDAANREEAAPTVAPDEDLPTIAPPEAEPSPPLEDSESTSAGEDPVTSSGEKATPGAEVDGVD